MDFNHSHPRGSEPLPVSQQQERLIRSVLKTTDKNTSKKIIRELGLKVTDQRVLILEVIRSGPSHFTAQDIFEAIQTAEEAAESEASGSVKSGAIGFATVYRFLRTLSEHEYVTEVRMGGMPARYEWAGKRHHDHLTCVGCHKIVEFENAEIERLQEKVAKEFGFELTHHLLELYGRCPDCRSSKD